MDKTDLIPLTAVVLAFVCFLLAGSVMEGYQDCAAMGGLSFCVPGSLPANCAEGNTLMDRNIFEYCGAGLLLLAGFFPLLITYREKQFLEDENRSVLSLS